MPVSTTRDDYLSPMLLHRLEWSLPLQERALTVSALCNLLHSVRNVEPVTWARPPSDPAACGAMGQIYLRLATPVRGAQAGPCTEKELRTIQMMHYLHEVDTAHPVTDATATSGPLRQSQLHAHLLFELRREFGLLPFPYAIQPQWRELAVNSAAAMLLTESIGCGLQPTDVRAFDICEVLPLADKHAGGLMLQLAAWNAAAPPPNLPTQHTGADVWDPSDPLDSGGLDLSGATLVRQWAGVVPLRSPR